MGFDQCDSCYGIQVWDPSAGTRVLGSECWDPSAGILVLGPECWDPSDEIRVLRSSAEIRIVRFEQGFEFRDLSVGI